MTLWKLCLWIICLKIKLYVNDKCKFEAYICLNYDIEYCELYAKEDNIDSGPSEESDKDVSEDDEVSDGRSASSEDEVAGHTDL